MNAEIKWARPKSGVYEYVNPTGRHYRIERIGGYYRDYWTIFVDGQPLKEWNHFDLLKMAKRRVENMEQR